MKHLRLNTDGEGVRSLIITSECPLNCVYCINDFCHNYPKEKLLFLSTEELYDKVEKYKLYFQYTGGGVTFGGGEPMQYSDYILDFTRRFNKIFSVCIETSLNVDIPDLEELAKYIKAFYVDIKDMNPIIYQNYTSKSNDKVIENLEKLLPFSDKVVIRLPYIRNYNLPIDVENSREKLLNLGYKRFNELRYIVR